MRKAEAKERRRKRGINEEGTRKEWKKCGGEEKRNWKERNVNERTGKDEVEEGWSGEKEVEVMERNRG